MQIQAKLKKVGRWSGDEDAKHIRTIQWNIDDLKSFFEKNKGIKIDAVVEMVLLFNYLEIKINFR